MLAAIPNVKTTLMAGFTTVRDVGTYRALNDVALRDAIAKGIIPGPRMFVAGAYITITGGAGAMTGISPDVQLPLGMRYGEANSPWEVRQKVRLLVSHGANVIKVLSTGAVLTHGSNKQSQEFTPEELAAAVDEAHQFGLKVAAHAHSAQGIKNAVRAGVASIEHGTYLDDEGIRLMKEHGTFLSATLEVHDCISSNPHTPAGFPGAQRGHRRHPLRGVPKSVAGGGEDRVLDGRAGVSVRPGCEGVQLHGEERDDPDAGDSGGDDGRRGADRRAGQGRITSKRASSPTSSPSAAIQRKTSRSSSTCSS